jgi:putative two-component system response regulator
LAADESAQWLFRFKQIRRDLSSIKKVLFSLANAVEARDAFTQGHIERVADLAVATGRMLRLSARTLEALRVGAVLHDIGNIGVPGDILNQPGKLRPEKWKVIRKHPEVGYEICSALRKTLGPALDAIRHHHEKLDGSGYPDGLQGNEISLVARVMAAVDIYDALRTERPYRKGMPGNVALAILRREAEEGKLDSQVVECLAALVDKEGRASRVEVG